MTPRPVLALALALLTAACTAAPRQPSPTSPVSTTTTVSRTTTTTLSAEDATTRFRSCLVDSGVPIDEIPLDSEGRPRLELALAGVDFSDPDAVEALTACSEYLAAGALDLSMWPQLQRDVQDRLAEFSDCVRTHGVAGFPDPVSSFTGVGGPFPLDEIPYDDPDLETAVASCRIRLTGEQ